MKKIWLLFALLLMLTPLISAYDFSEPSDEDKATFDEILEPVLKIYNFVKYIASVIAVVIMLFAGVTYMISGSDPKKRDQAKGMAMYVIIGLIVIWAAPLIVDFIVG